ncbi:MAG: hypothetical protein IPM02_22360 [Betaproteobacteria bacterium]|nr:hypothetical protein [Betaproteobacteria bacterium]
MNVDARKFEHTHLVSDGFELAEFTDGSIGEIYLCHVLEHFSILDGEIFLRRLRTKLCAGGLIRISVPDFDTILEIYEDSGRDVKEIRGILLGGQEYAHNFHKSVFNGRVLEELLTDCGYVNVTRWTTEEDFGVDLGDWSNKTITSKRTEFSRLA